MRAIDDNTLNALSGSRAGDRIIVWPWYDGSPTLEEPLPVTKWSIGWDSSKLVNTFSCTVADKDGSLAPWRFDDVLGVGGARLQVIYEVGGGGQINLGWYRVTAPDPEEEWSVYRITEAGTTAEDSPLPAGQVLRMVPRGAVIQVESEELAGTLRSNQFLAPESPQKQPDNSPATIVSEIKRIAGDTVPVSIMDGVVDRTVSTKLVYKDDRLEAIQDLATRIGCDIRFNGDGMLEVYPLDATGSAGIVLKGGPRGLLMKVHHKQSYDGLYNIFVADGTNPGTQQPVRGMAMITGGPLRVDGPHGRYPKFYSSTMITSQTEADNYAAQMRDTQLAGMTIDLDVVCLPLPHLQQGDWATVYCPTPDGRVVPLTGRVLQASLSGSDKGVDPMSVTVQCNYNDVLVALGSASNYSISGPIKRK